MFEIDQLKARIISDARLTSSPVFEIASSAKNFVFARDDNLTHTNVQAPFLIIGEAPGKEEDQIGKPFCGRSGKLLDTVILESGLQNVYITNAVFWRPKTIIEPVKNRPPTKNEIAWCRPYLLEHIEIIKPRAIMTLGLVPYYSLFNIDKGHHKINLRSLKAKKHFYDEIEVILNYHPAFIMRKSHIPEYIKEFKACFH